MEILRGANKEHRTSRTIPPSPWLQGTEINAPKLGILPLMLTAKNGHTAAAKLLLDMGSDINAQIETNRNTALTLAYFQGRHEVESLLLDRKANMEHRAKTGLTLLMEVCIYQATI